MLVKRCLIAAVAVTWPLFLRADPSAEYAGAIRPILEKHCFECHGVEKQKADLDLAALKLFTNTPAQLSIWRLVQERIQAFEMPPKGRPELAFSEHQKLVQWLASLPRQESIDCNQLASDRNTSFYHGYVMSRRLNRAEYNATIRDLVGMDLRLQELLPADGGGGEGFDTSGSALFVSPIHIEKYLRAADHVLQSILVDRTTLLSQAQVAARERVLAPGNGTGLTDRDNARRVIETFARRAFRRSTTEAELASFVRLYDLVRDRGDDHLSGLRLALKGILVSPHFLFLSEPEPAEGGLQPLPPVPLASRLSYFLWSSMPDDELLAVAENRDLLRDDVYRYQIRRMLADPKSAGLSERFVLQWLDLERLGGEIHPDASKYPEFNEALSASMKAEVTTFFDYLIRENRPLLELIDADYTFVNSSLARLYNMPCADGPELAKVSLTTRTRGGLVGMAAVHAVTSFPTRTSPVLRGKWILETLLGEKVPPPPPDVPALELGNTTSAPRSLRQQLEIHRARAECVSCHSKMDPLGFGLENFDPLGRWRDSDFGQPVDAEGTLPSGQKFVGPEGLKSLLMSRKADVVRHLVRKMAGFAYGRELNPFDDCAVDRTVKALADDNYRAAVLIEQIALSFPFRHRFYPKTN